MKFGFQSLLGGGFPSLFGGGGTPTGGPTADPFAAQRGMYQRQLAALMNDPSAFQKTPFYQSQLAAGTAAIDRGAAASGMLNSGGRAVELQSFGQTLANQSFMNYAKQLGEWGGSSVANPGAGAAADAARAGQRNDLWGRVTGK